MKETMSPKERWLAVLNRKKPDRVPMDIWITPEAEEKLKKHLAFDWEGVLERLHIDTPITVAPRYDGPPLEPNTDIWGVKSKPVNYGSGVYHEVTSAPLAKFSTIDEIDAHYTWPSPDWFDYSQIPGSIKGKEKQIIRGGGSEPFLKYKHLRGETQAFMDLMENPEIVHYCLDKMFDFCYNDTLRIFETIPGKVSITYVAEDLGGQNAIMFSPEHIRQFLFPRMKRMAQLTHQNGSFVFTHSDGSFREVIPDIIQMGADVLNPIQWRCKGMDRQGLKKEFGQSLIFHGGVDNQQTLPFGSTQDVRREVTDNYNILGAGGGYILAPCHNIQSVTPPENIVAMYDAGYEYGWR